MTDRVLIVVEDGNQSMTKSFKIIALVDCENLEFEEAASRLLLRRVDEMDESNRGVDVVSVDAECRALQKCDAE